MNIELMQQISNILTVNILFHAALMASCSIAFMLGMRKFLNSLPAPRQIS
jgi:hypothetical protein